MPAYFPPLEKTADLTSVVPELPKEDLEEVSESNVGCTQLLTHFRYIRFSCKLSVFQDHCGPLTFFQP